MNLPLRTTGIRVATHFCRLEVALYRIAFLLALLGSASVGVAQTFPTASQPDTWVDGSSGTTQTRRALHSPNSLLTCSGNWDGVHDPRPCSCTDEFPPCSGPNPKVQLRVSGGHIVVDYDAPNLYCENDGLWPPGYPSGPAPFYLQIVQGQSSISTWIAYEYGTWDTGWTITCDGLAHGTYTATISYSCSPLINPPLSATDTQTLSCTPPQNAPTCGFGGGSQGPGGVSIGPNGPATWTEAPIAGPLAPTFFYNGNSTSSSDTGLAPGWFYDYGESLRPNGTGVLVWTDRFGFRRTFVGSDANGYVATDPGDARGLVTLVSSNYVLTTPDGTSRTFIANSNGYWVKTVDRWGNGAQGNTSGSARPATISELFGGATTGRQLGQSFSGGQLSTVTDAKAGTTQLTYDASGRLSTICAADQSCPSGNPWRTFQYDGASSRLALVKDAQGFYRRGYTYNASFGVDTTWIGSATFGAGKERSKYVPSGSTVTVQRYKDDGTTADTTYTYSAIAGLYRVTQISGTCPECGDENSTTSFDPTFGFPTSRTDGNGHTTKKTYDGLGNVKIVTEAYGTSLARTTTYDYADPNLDALPSAWAGGVRDFWKKKTLLNASVKSGQSVTISRTWSGTSNLNLNEATSGYLTSSDTVATTRSTITTYDISGRLTTFNGPRTDVADVTTYTYYGSADNPVAVRNRLKQQTDPVGITTTYDSYDALGGATQQTLKGNPPASDVDVVTQFSYDARGRLVTRTLKATSGAEADLVTTNDYGTDGRGRLISTFTGAASLPVTTKSLFTYEDGTDRLLTRTESTQANGSGDRVTYLYDDQGNVKTETYGYFDGTATTTDYQVTKNFDARCHVKSQTYPADNATTQYTYDCVGNLLTVQDSMHTSPNITYQYDELNRLHQITRTATAIPPSNDVTTYSYDALDHLIQVTDPNSNSTFYLYDDFGGLRQQTTTLAGGGQLDITTNGYDPANNLISTGTGQASTRRNYDAANKLLAVKSTSGALSYTLYTYDTGCLADPTTGLQIRPWSCLPDDGRLRYDDLRLRPAGPRHDRS
jgi:YD repeat-containing protein